MAHILGLNQSPDLGSGRNFALGHICRIVLFLFPLLCSVGCGWLPRLFTAILRNANDPGFRSTGGIVDPVLQVSGLPQRVTAATLDPCAETPTQGILRALSILQIALWCGHLHLTESL